MSTDAVVEQPEADLIVDIQHPDLFPGLLVVGSGAMTVVLRSLRDCSLADGEVLGPASLLTAVTGSTHAADDTGGADSVRADLGHLLGQSIDTQAGSLAVDSVSTATLATYVSENEAINIVLEDLRSKLPSHMMQLQLDLADWSPQQVDMLGTLLLKQQGVFSSDKWDIGYCTALPFDIILKP